mgnify:CR=1 FL=1
MSDLKQKILAAVEEELQQGDLRPRAPVVTITQVRTVLGLERASPSLVSK